MSKFYTWSQVHAKEISAIGKSRGAKGIFFQQDRDEDSINAAHAARLSGIAFSGGGIRSASFNLGILQGLANLGIFHIFDYLSTVSGGGYIGSWLSAWIFRRLRTISDPAFTEEEFVLYDPEKLRQNIENKFGDLFGGSSHTKPIEWLNLFLEHSDLYKHIGETGQGSLDSQDILARLKAAKPDRSPANDASQALEEIKLMNRLILENEFINQVPKYKQRIENAPAQALNQVMNDLKTSEKGDPADGGDQSRKAVNQRLKKYREAAPIRFLREYSNYLTPKRGLSTDSLTLGVAYTINFAINLIVLILILGAVLTTPLLVVKIYDLIHSWSAPHFVLPVLSVIFLISSIFCAFRAQHRTTEDRKQLFHIRGFVALFLLMSVFFSISLWKLTLPPASWWQWSLGTAAVFVLALSAGKLLAGPLKKFRGEDRQKMGPAKFPEGGEIFAALVSGLVSGPLFYWVAYLLQDWSPKTEGIWQIAVWGYLLVLLILGIATIAYTGIAGKSQPEDQREWTFRLWALIAKFAAIIGALLIVGIYGPILAKLAGKPIGTYIASTLTAGWLITTIGRALAWKGRAQNQKKARAATRIIARAAPYIFTIGLLLLLSIGLHYLWMATLVRFTDVSLQDTTYWSQLNLILDYWLIPLIGAIIFITVAMLVSLQVGVNQFSLHSLYGNRLVRAYLGASNPDNPARPDQSRRDPFTFFNPSDNDVRLHFLSSLYRKDLIYPGPYPLINTTINLAKSKNLAWQKRKGASFVFSPVYSGFERYVPAEDASNKSENEEDGAYVLTRAYSSEGGVSLGKALTISGAAASPNMGYYTSVPLAFLMTVFNLRLGWWLGNPLKQKETLLKSKGPEVGFPYLLSELLATAGDNSRYIYLSDGGHFENLGIYELVKRRCRYIVACDASCDEDMEFNDLGNAIEKCRTDFGIDILINVDQLRKQSENGNSAWHCAVGEIHYSAVDGYAQDGILLYIKSSLTGDEPIDIVRYASQCPDFPHQSTADQWFDETQFESYRRLGEHIARVVFQEAAANDKVHLTAASAIADNNKPPPVNIERLFHELKKRWYPPIPAVEKAFAQHSAGLERILTRLKSDDNLRFLDTQMYPALYKLGKHFLKNKPVDGPLPSGRKELRAGFYLCKEMLVFMESVYHDLNLDENFEHPDNRGWINLFHRWAWSRMFRFTWSVTASTFGARFQTFCEQKMKFKRYQVKIGIDEKGTPRGLEVDTNIIREYASLKERADKSDDAQPPKHLTKFWKKAQHIYDFNHFEIKLLKDLILTNMQTCTVYPVFIVSDDNPIEDNQKFDFNVGFIMLDNSRKELYYFRIQNHLRQMGLARETLRVFLCDECFRKHTVDINLTRPSADALEVPTDRHIEDFKILFQTVKSEVETFNNAGEGFKEEKIGTVVSYFSNKSVAAIKLTDDTLSAGDTILLLGHGTDFVSEVSSMQIEHKSVKEAQKGDKVGIKVPDRVSAGDKVYKIVAE